MLPYAHVSSRCIRRRLADAQPMKRRQRYDANTREELIQASLWNSCGREPAPGVVAQYELYVASAEKVSQRRGVSNNFFLLVNSAASVALVTFGVAGNEAEFIALLFSTIVMVGLCALWAITVHSHRQLSGAKWAVVNAMEERLPSAPWASEWKALGKGRNGKTYRRLTTIEKWVPCMFASVYAVGFLILTISR